MSLFYTLFVNLLFPALAFAQEDTSNIDPCAGGNSSLAICKSAGLGIGTALGSVIQFLFVIAVILALGFLVYGGIRWITSGGDKGGVETARNTLIAAIVGLVVIFLAYVVLNLVLIFLTGKGISGIEIPTLGGASAAGSHDSADSDSSCGGGGELLCGQSGSNARCDTGFKPDFNANPATCVAF